MSWNYKNIAKNIFWLASNEGLNLVAMLLFSIAITRVLGLEHLAAYSYVFGFISPVLQTLCDAGFNINLVRDLNNNGAPYHYTVIAQKTKFILWLFTLPIALGLYVVDGFGLHLYYGLFASAILLVNLLNESYVAVFRAYSNAAHISKINSKITFLEYLLALALILVFHNLFFSLIAILACDTAKLLISKKITLRTYFPDSESLKNTFEKTSIKTIFKRLNDSNLNIIIYSFLNTFYFRMPLMLLTWYSPTAEIAYYSVAQKFITALRVLPGSILYVLTPEFAKTKEKINYLPFALLAFGICASLFIFSDLIIDLTYKLYSAIPVLKTMSIFFFFFFIRFIFEAKIFAMKKEKILIWLTIATLAIYFITINVLSFTALNASLALLISEVFLFISLLIAFKTFNRVKVHIDDKIDAI